MNTAKFIENNILDKILLKETKEYDSSIAEFNR